VPTPAMLANTGAMREFVGEFEVVLVKQNWLCFEIFNF
jgi:hypothetical protein